MEALQREVYEEVGLEPSSYRIVCFLGGFRYRYGKDNEKRERWIGQQQTYFLLLCHGERPEVDISLSPEFSRVEWRSWRELRPKIFVRAKRDAIAKLLQSFFPENMEIHELIAYLEHQITPRRYLHESAERIDLMATACNEQSLFAEGKEEASVLMMHLSKDIQSIHSSLEAKKKGRLLVIFHGLDGSGCDSSLRKLCRSLDPFGLRVETLLSASEQEMSAYNLDCPEHLLTPQQGELLMLDRSLYYALGKDMLTGACDEAHLSERMRCLRDSEQRLSEQGTHIIKIFLNISQPEQQRRLEKRRLKPAACPRLQVCSNSTEGQWQRETELAQQMLSLSCSQSNPWYILPADVKWYRNFCIARILLDRLRSMLIEED